MADNTQEVNAAMLTDLTQLLPQNIADGALVAAWIGMAIGAGLWIFGVKVSRPIVTLVTTLLGAVIGLQLPRWFSWNVGGAAPAVGAALVLGVTGFVLHRMWIGLSFGIVLALWTAFVIFIAMHDPAHPWTWPAPDANAKCIDYAKSVWATVPPNMAHVLPFACGAAVVSGLAACIIWPRLSTAAHWAILGLTMFIGLGLTAVAHSSHSDCLNRVPQKPGTQVGVIAGLLLVGTFVQWKLTPKPAAAAPAPKADDQSEL